MKDKIDNVFYFITLWIAFVAIALNVISIGIGIINLIK